MDEIKIILVDDHLLFRTGIKTMLSLPQSKIAVVGEAGSAKEFFELNNTTDADVILLDILLPDISGVDIARMIKNNHPHTKILILSSESDCNLLRELLEIGIEGFISKNTPFEELKKGILTVADGGQYFGRDIAELLYSIRVSKPNIPNNIFTHRELEIIQLCSEGFSSKEISGKLFISMKTVDSHKYNIFKKLGINNSVELVCYAVKNHLISM